MPNIYFVYIFINSDSLSFSSILSPDKDMFMVDLGKAECKQVTIQDCVDRDMLPKEFEVELRPLDAFIEAFDLTEEKLEVCTCSDKDLCNRAFNTTGGFLAIILTSLVAFNGFILG